MIDTKPIPWKLAGIWNSAAMTETHPLRERDYIYASELGQPFYDRYLKMNAVPFTTPPNERSRRKFLMGKLVEFMCKQVLITTGLFHKEEVTVNEQPFPKGLSVHGRCDFVAGGFIDREEALERLETILLPDFMEIIGRKIIDHFAGQNLERKILETKAVSTYVFEKVTAIGRALPHNGLQGYHYQRNGTFNCDLCYICKDDARIAQFELIADEIEPLYEDDILRMTTYFKKKKTPPLAPLLSFDSLAGKFSKNIFVEYSNYLTHYGFKNPDEYRKAVKFIESWNRCLSRYALVEIGQLTPTGRQMEITTKNKEVRADIEKAGFKFKDLLDIKIKLGAVEEEEVEA